METSAFAKRLAANEQPKRDRAIKKLRKYIAVKTAKTGGFSKEELLQLWKGLHYCFWMQDKPLLQEELSGKLCGLLKAFPDAGLAMSFAAAFFTTQAREWGRLDQWRMDKYMMLIRDFLHATLEVVQRNRWQDSLVGAVSAMLEEVMDAGKEDIPDGFRLHLADIYLDEVEKVGAAELNGDQINMMLNPFLQYIVNSKRDAIANKIIARVFGTILQTPPSSRGNGDQGKEENITPTLQFNYQGLGKMMFDAGRQKNILPKVRRKLYKLVKRFSDMGQEGSQTSPLHGKRKHADWKDKEPEKKKKKKTEEEEKESGKEKDNPEKKENKKKKEKGDEKWAEKEHPTLSEVNQPTPPSSPKRKKHKANHEKDAPELTPKHVAFDLDRNSSRGLQDFVKSTTSSPSPYLPSRSPHHGILKDSPSVIPPSPTAETIRTASHQEKKHFRKGHASPSKGHHSVGLLTQKSVSKKKWPKGETSSKFDSKRRGKVMKKPKRR